MRLINADALEKTLRDWIRDHWTDAFTGDDAGAEFADIIDHAKTIDANPTVHAHWVPQHPNNRTGKAHTFVCSNCKKFAIRSRQASIDELGYVFCPHCAAKMDEEENET